MSNDQPKDCFTKTLENILQFICCGKFSTTSATPKQKAAIEKKELEERFNFKEYSDLPSLVDQVSGPTNRDKYYMPEMLFDRNAEISDEDADYVDQYLQEQKAHPKPKGAKWAKHKGHSAAATSETSPKKKGPGWAKLQGKGMGAKKEMGCKGRGRGRGRGKWPGAKKKPPPMKPPSVVKTPEEEAGQFDGDQYKLPELAFSDIEPEMVTDQLGVDPNAGQSLVHSEASANQLFRQQRADSSVDPGLDQPYAPTPQVGQVDWPNGQHHQAPRPPSSTGCVQKPAYPSTQAPSCGVSKPPSRVASKTGSKVGSKVGSKSGVKAASKTKSKIGGPAASKAKPEEEFVPEF